MKTMIKTSTLSLAALGFLCGSASLSAVVNTTGYIQSTGTPSLTFSTSGSTPRFLWDPGKLHFQAGSGLPSSTSVGQRSMAFGSSVTSSGNYSMAFGQSAASSGNYSLAFGLAPTSSAAHSLSFGILSGAYADGAVAIGISNNSSGSNAFALGSSNSTGGSSTFALGSGNSVNGHGSGAFGRSSSVNIGANDTAFAMGYGLTVRQPNAFVVGRFNSRTSTSADGYIFVVGKGTGTLNRSDALTLSSGGNLWVSGTITAVNGIVGGPNMIVGTSTTSSYIQFRTGGSNRMRITADGDVGIGTISPAEKLDIVGNARVTGTVATGALSATGYIQSTGNTSSLTYGSTSSPRFLWDPGKKHFQAGQSLPASATVGNYSMSFGSNTTSTGNYSLAFGLAPSSSADHSLTFGILSGAYAAGAVAIGVSNNSSGSNAFALGSNNSTGGSNTFALGSGNSAFGFGSGAFGRSSSVNIDANDTAFALGYGISVWVPDAVVLGRYNDKGRNSNDNVAFVVGTGTGIVDDSNRYRDGLRLDKQGNLWVKGTISVQPQGDIPMGKFQ